MTTPTHGTHLTHGDAHRDVQLEVRRTLADRWDDVQPRIAITDPGADLTVVYVSTSEELRYEERTDIRSAALCALIPHTPGTPNVEVRFQTW